MPIETPSTAGAALDGYDAYYSEKLWQWIPGFYREKDAYTDTPGALRALIESMGTQSAELRRELDRIWENHFVELADDVALEQLGALVATRMVHVLNRRGRRVDVAKTIWYRRRKGTPRVLESLATDIAGWLGAHLEARRRLARSVHLLEPADPISQASQAIFTGTPRGGWANLRSPRIPALAFGAFEELAHTPDFRPLQGTRGRYNIPKIGLHVHRMRAFEINNPTVVQIGADPGVGEAWKYALDPSGRAAALFQVADRPSSEGWVRQREWQMPKAIERRLLAHTEFEWDKAKLAAFVLSAGPLDAGTIPLLSRYIGLRVPSVRALQQLFASFPAPIDGDLDTNIVAFMEATLVPACGRAQLYGPDPIVGGNQALTLGVGANNDTAALKREAVQSGNLVEWGASWDLSAVLDPLDPLQQLIVDPQLGAVISRATDGSNPVIAHVLHYGFPGEVGAGSYDRRESIVSEAVSIPNLGNALGPIGATLATAPVEVLVDNKTYEVTADLVGVTDYRLQAKNFTRPYLRYAEATIGDHTTWTISALAKVLPTDLRCLVFDGLWIGLHDTSASPEIVSAGDPCSPVGGRLVLAGTWDRVEISHCTLDPGGEKLREIDTECEAIQYLTLEVAGYIEELVIERSIVGPILGTVAGEHCAIGKLIIRDSVVAAYEDGIDAINVEFGEVHIERSTIGGEVVANRLYASDSLFAGTGTIADLQHGCFRFCAGVQGTWPRPYESHFFSLFDSAWFDSLRLGDAGFLRFNEAAPLELRTGAENHGEVGVWNHLIEPIKRADLRAKLDEFMPFDLHFGLITEN